MKHTFAHNARANEAVQICSSSPVPVTAASSAEGIAVAAYLMCLAFQGKQW